MNAFAVFAGPSRTTYQAKIVKPDGYPLEAAGVNFKFTILDPSGSCILFSETYSSVNMTNTGGLISFSLGSGVKSYPVSATTFEQVFSNITPNMGCDTGGGAPAVYTPLANDARKIIMQFNDGNGWQTLPAMNINAVPYAMYANDSMKFNGMIASDFVQVSSVPTCTASEALRYTGTAFQCVAAGGSGPVTSGSVVTALGYTPVNSTSFTSVVADVGSVSSTVFSVSSTVTSLQNSITASLAAITSSQWLTSGTSIYYASGNVGIGTLSPTAAFELNAPVSAAFTTQFKVTDGTTGGYFSVSEGASQLPRYLPTFDFRSASVSGYGGAMVGHVQTEYDIYSAAGAGIVLDGRTSSDTALTNSNLLVVRNMGVAKLTVQASGTVGIGVAIPATKLDVAGGIKIGTESNSCSASLAGTLRYNSGVVEYCNGTSWAAFGVSGAGILAINGLASGSQTFAFGNSGTTPNVSSTGSVHTFNFPYASVATTTAGVISYNDYLTFANKQSATSAAIAATLGYTPADTVSVTTLSSTVGSVSSSLASVSATLNSVSGAVTSLANTVSSSFATLTSTQWLSNNIGIYYASGTVGVGTIPNSLVSGTNQFSSAYINRTTNVGSGSFDFGLYITNAATNTASSSRILGVFSAATALDNSNPNSYLAGVEGRGIASMTAATVTGDVMGGYFQGMQMGGGYVNNLYGAKFSVGSYGSITGSALNYYGVYIATPSYTGSGAVSNAYSLYLGSPTVAQNNNFAIYQTGNAKNYFGGGIGIGTVVSETALDVSGVMRAGTASATSGSDVLYARYGSTSETTGVIGTRYSTGGLFLGYGIKAGQDNTNPYLSSYDNSSAPRSVVQVSSDIEFLTAPAQTTAVNQPVSMTQRMVITSTGNIGIGTSTPTGKLELQTTVSNTTLYNINASMTHSTVTSGSYNLVGVHTWVRPGASTGATNTATAYGVANRIVRNTTAGVDDNGTQTALYGEHISFGHSNVGGASPTTLTMAGLYIDSQLGAGTVNNYTALRLASPSTSGAIVINRWGLAQDDTIANNYFLGNLGLGVSAPVARLQIGAGSATRAPLRMTAGTLLSAAQSGTIEYDGSTYYVTDDSGVRRAISTGSSSGTVDNASNVNATTNITMTPSGSVVVSSTTASTNVSTGALIVKGGLGVAGTINAGAVSAAGTITAPYFLANTASLGTNAGDYVDMQSWAGNNGNLSYLDVRHIRTSSGTSWFSAGTRMQQKVDSTWMSYVQFNGNGNDYGLSFGTGSSIVNPNNVSERMRITNAGYVGIGTSSPTKLVHVQVDQNSDTALLIKNASSGASAMTALDLEGDANGVQLITYSANATGNWGGNTVSRTNTAALRSYTTLPVSNMLIGTGSSSPLHLMTGDTPRVTVTSAGKVGIGTISPTDQLHVFGVATVTSGTGNLSMIPDYLGSAYLQSYQSVGVFRPLKIDGLGVSFDAKGGAFSFASGNVGIGVTSATYKVQIAGSSVSGAGGQTNISAFTGNGLNIQGSISNNSQDAITYQAGGSGGGAAIAFRRGGSYDTYLDFYTNSTNTPGAMTRQMVLSSNGYLGLGTSAPSLPLDLNLNNGYLRSQLGDGGLEIGSGNDDSSYIDFHGNNNLNADFVGRIEYEDNAGMAFNVAGNAAPSLFIASSTGYVGVGTTAPGAKFSVYTANAGGYTIISNRNGAAGGQDWRWYSSSTGAPLGTDSMCFGTGVCYFSLFTTGNATLAGTLTQSSDVRLKRDIASIPDALLAVSKLDGVTYYWKDSAKDPNKQIGLIAQDVEKVFPEAVMTGANGFKSVAYQNLIAPVINAIKEIREWMFKTDDRLSALEKARQQDKAEIDQLKKQNETLKAYLCEKDPQAPVCN